MYYSAQGSTSASICNRWRQDAHMCVYGGSWRHWLMFLVSPSNTVIPLYGETITKKSSISHCFSPPAYFVFFYYFSPTGFHSTLKSFIQFHFQWYAKYDTIFAPSCFHKNFFLWKDTLPPSPFFRVSFLVDANYWGGAAKLEWPLNKLPEHHKSFQILSEK